MHPSNLFQTIYWFNQPEMARGLSLWILVGGFLLFILGGIAFKILTPYAKIRAKREPLRRAGNFCLTIGFFGLMWMFFRQEEIPFLAWRFWLLLLLGLFVWWLARIARYTVKRVPEIRKEQLEKERMEKYLPKAKK